MRLSIPNRGKMASLLTALGAVFCAWLLLTSSIGAVVTTDITIEIYDDYVTPSEYHVSVFGLKTFTFDLTGATGDVNIVVRISGALSNELVQFWADGTAPDTLGRLEPEAEWNVFILPLDRTIAYEYKLRLMGNTDMHFYFSIYNASQPPVIDGYTQVIGYPLPTAGNYNVEIDANPGWAYQLSLQSTDFIRYELDRNYGVYYSGELPGPVILRVQYLPPDFTGIRLHEQGQQGQPKFTLRFVPTPVLPSVGEGDVYTDLEDGKVHIRLSEMEDYINLFNLYSFGKMLSLLVTDTSIGGSWPILMALMGVSFAMSGASLYMTFN